MKKSTASILFIVWIIGAILLAFLPLEIIFFILYGMLGAPLLLVLERK